MTHPETPPGANLKQKLFEALQMETGQATDGKRSPALSEQPLRLEPGDSQLDDGKSVYGILNTEEADAELPEALDEELRRSSERLRGYMEQAQQQKRQKTDFDDTLTMRGMVPGKPVERSAETAIGTSPSKKDVKLESVISGGSMADLSGYRDLSKAPMSFGDDDMPTSFAPDTGFERAHTQAPMSAPANFSQDLPAQDVDTEFSGNVKTLIRLVNELPEGVTKQTGAQIIRLTMEAMGISMEDVLSEAQSAQSEMLDAVRANIKKIEEYKTVIRKLETDIKYYQGKANELSEIIDLFILSNTSGNKMPSPDDLGR